MIDALKPVKLSALSTPSFLYQLYLGVVICIACMSKTNVPCPPVLYSPALPYRLLNSPAILHCDVLLSLRSKRYAFSLDVYIIKKRSLSIYPSIVAKWSVQISLFSVDFSLCLNFPVFKLSTVLRGWIFSWHISVILKYSEMFIFT